MRKIFLIGEVVRKVINSGETAIGSPEVPAEQIVREIPGCDEQIPGRTTEAEHQVTTTGVRPVRLPPYIGYLMRTETW